ncbi:MAG: hypothetical protein HRU35_03095 [Rickettsiaceae bacterium]|nr:hypothetical protein [Rickettsiaceae bacterium]
MTKDKKDKKDKKEEKQDQEVKYEPLELKELPKSAVVNSNAYAEESKQDRLINEAVSDHLSTIVDNQDTNADNVSQTISTTAENNSATEQSNAQQQAESSQITDPKLEVNEAEIQPTKTASNQMPPEQAPAQQPANTVSEDVNTNNDQQAPPNQTSEVPQQTEPVVNTDNFSQILLEKLSSVTADVDLDSQITKFSATAISAIAKKLYLALPVDFEKIISNELIEKVKKFYKEGKITLTINPEKYDFCKEVLQSDNIPDKLKGSFEVVKDDNLGAGDCKIAWQNTCLEYNQEQLSAEIDKIIEQLKNAT